MTTNGHRELTQADIDALWHNQAGSRHDMNDAAGHGIALCRAALAEAKRGLCPHGVGWRNCHQHNPNQETT
jgi:hypothetical protein